MVRNPRYTLYWKDIVLGAVEHTGSDFPWLVGRYMLEDLPPIFNDLFRFMTSENNLEQDPPFDAEFLADENWLLISEDGEEIEICIPAIYLDEAEIRWRLRSKNIVS